MPWQAFWRQDREKTARLADTRLYPTAAVRR